MIQILHREVAQGSRVAALLLDEIMTYPGCRPIGDFRATDWIVSGHDDAASEATFVSLLFHLYDAAMPTDARLQKIEDRMLLSGGQRDCREARELALWKNIGR